MPTRPPACAEEAFRDALHDPPRDGLSSREAEADGRPWCLHLSYIKPHWPYIAPEPYASMYGAGDMLPAVRSERRAADRPRIRCSAPTMDMRYLPQHGARRGDGKTVIPTYMGLIRQIDDQMGVLMAFLEANAACWTPP